MTKTKAPSGIVVLNYARSKVSLPSADDVPTLIDKNALAILQEGDENPYYKIEALEYPANGAGGVYEKSFFKSFLNAIKERPLPGSKRGHEYASRAASDFYTIGGSMVDNADGKSGIVYLKMYIPPMGYTDSNAGFIRDAKVNNVHFSLVTSPEYKMVKDENGRDVLHFTSSKGWERNDAVGHGEGAMEQVVNRTDSLDYEQAMELIEAGKYDAAKNVEGGAIQNGIVYRSALRRIASSASETDRPLIGQLLSAIDKKKNRRNNVDKEELFALLKNMIANAQTNIGEIAKAVGLEALVKNSKDSEDLGTLRELNSILGDKPIEAARALMESKKAGDTLAFENALTAKVGQKIVKNGEGKDVESPAYTYAAMKCAGLSGDALKNSLDALCTDPVMVSIRGNMADQHSGVNKLENGGKTAGKSGDVVIAPRSV